MNQPAVPATPGSAVDYMPASWRDLSDLRQLENLCFPRDAWPLLDMIGTLTLPGVVRFKAVKKDQVVGFVAGDIKKIQGTGWIATICVHPDHRGQGIGWQLLDMCEQAMGMPRIKLSVRASNHTAISIYQRNGYRTVDRWPRYYRGGEDALVMEKMLPITPR